MIRFFKTLFIIFLIIISLLGFSFYKTNIVYHKATRINFEQVLDDTSGRNVYLFYAIGESNTESIQFRINQFYEECLRLGIDFYIIDMSLDENSKYASEYPNTPGANPYPEPNQIKEVDDIFISQVPALLYTYNGEVINFKEGSASIIYMMNDILSEVSSPLVLDTN